MVELIIAPGPDWPDGPAAAGLRSLRRGLTYFGGAYFFHEFLRVPRRLLHLPERRLRLIFDLDSTVVTVFGKRDKSWKEATHPLERELGSHAD